MPSRADRMLLLARVEVARESRRRSELTTAEDELRAATANAAEAANSFQRARQERSLILSQWYAGSAGRHAATFVQDLRTTERTQAAHQQTALQASQAAETTRQQAAAECETARAALRAASMRAVRRRRMGDTLEQQERRATMIAEEEVLAEELMERITGAANA